MKQDNSRPLIRLMRLCTAIVVILLFFFWTGCTYFKTRTDISEVQLDGTDVYSYENALNYVVEKINATRYGIVMRNKVDKRKRIIDYSEIYLKLTQRTTRVRSTSSVVFIIELTNYCNVPDDTDNTLLGMFERTYTVSSKKPEQLCKSLLSLGVQPCTPEESM